MYSSKSNCERRCSSGRNNKDIKLRYFIVIGGNDYEEVIVNKLYALCVKVFSRNFLFNGVIDGAVAVHLLERVVLDKCCSCESREIKTPYKLQEKF